ncbi:septum site-determining protein MinC [Calothrix sp. 336/3]|uniref:septum site-determining protein MinC n=1 Tax=Calothrix sp. 336/3 TaxID=1337936 RepID=UPI0004E4342A|nr:septum site-determining protein MinC [Calothrix sp. 336/3]AKG20203.1 hypothetical protein IJ00_01765 [Calothrix sp. 336/3]
MFPDLDANSADAEPISSLTHLEAESSNPVLPDVEVESVLLYLKENTEIPPSVEEEKPEIPAETSEIELDLDSLDAPLPEGKVKQNVQVQIKSEAERLLLILPTESQLPASEVSWSEMWQQLKVRLNGSDRLRIPHVTVHLLAGDRLLDTRQLQELAETLKDIDLHLKSVATSRRQTAIAAATVGYSVEQIQRENTLASPPQTTTAPLADPLYVEMTVRSGVDIRHPGTVIVMGDVNPGGSIVADGDILIWGRLRGLAHAGANGNRDCLIMALQMEPTQLRIAEVVARAPEKSPSQFYPEVAYVTEQGIRITRAVDFSKAVLSRNS